VPVLVDGATVVPGSLEILDWIETRFPEPALQPRDAVGRDQARAIYERVNRLIPLVPRILRGAPEEQDAARRAARAALEDLEGEAPAEWFLLGDLSIADLALASFVMKLPLDLRPSALGLPFLSRWEAAIAARPGVARHAAPRRAA
jgi:glutathione S-transferase